jgi:hypothetical protein
MTVNTITLCGSTRFLSHFDAANIELTRQGLSVISISMALPKNEQGNEFEEGLKQYLDLVHFNKILRSDGIFIVGTGYIGKSTAREILWAHMQNKAIVTEWAMNRYNNKWEYAAASLRSGTKKMRWSGKQSTSLACSKIQQVRSSILAVTSSIV